MKIGLFGLVVLIAALGGCTDSHGLGDSGADAFAADGGIRDAFAPDASGPDAFVRDVGSADIGIDAFCIDADGDGFAAVACGGYDCDDFDPDFHPGVTRCAGPTAIERCADGLVSLEECPTGLADCDARSGACAATACGDAVVHPDEECDDGDPAGVDMCDRLCRAVCYDATFCIDASRPACIPDEDPSVGEGHCGPRVVGGSPLGAPCASDEACESGWCDPNAAECSQLCTTTCAGAPESWCSVWAEAWGATGAPPRPFRCESACGRTSDCAAPDFRCVLVFVSTPFNFLTTGCRASTGVGAIGDACVYASDCASGLCMANRCTCLTSADCEAPLPSCEGRPIPPPGEVPWPLLCWS